MAKKILFWWITSLLILILFYALTVNVILPALTKNPLPEVTLSPVESNIPKKTDKTVIKKKERKSKEKIDTTVSPVEIKTEGNTISATKEEMLALFELKKKETLLRSRLNLSAQDSIYLVLDLIHRIASLEIKGVTMHKCNIVKYDVSNSIKKFHTESLLHWMSQPFELENAEATIDKVPLQVKIAPKDTIEANKIDETPVVQKKEDVYIVMNFERNLQLTIDQVEIPEKSGKEIIDHLKWKYRKQELKKSLYALTTLKRNPSIPQIQLVLSQADATILYRALPFVPRMVLRM